MNTYELTLIWMGNGKDSKEFGTHTIEAESTKDALKKLIPAVASYRWFDQNRWNDRSGHPGWCGANEDSFYIRVMWMKKSEGRVLSYSRFYTYALAGLKPTRYNANKFMAGKALR